METLRKKKKYGSVRSVKDQLNGPKYIESIGICMTALLFSLSTRPSNEYVGSLQTK
jgi:hypothetical protein